MKRSLNVGVVGLGNMGLPIARNIAFKSRTALYLQLYSRNRETVSTIADHIAQDGAQCAIRLHHQLPTVTKWCDVVITCLKNADAQNSVMLEREDSLLRNARQGQIFIDHTTVDVEQAKLCAQHAESRGAFYLDSPLSGNPPLAVQGELTAMVGGPEKAFFKVLPLMRLYCENVERLGASGTGAGAKLVCQSLVAMHTIAAAEALTIADSLGITNREKLFSVLDASWGSSTMLRRCAPMMERLIRNPEMVPPAVGSRAASGFIHDNKKGGAAGTEALASSSSTSIDRVLDDISLIGRSAELRQEQLPVFAKSHNILWRSSHSGVGDRDLSGVVHFLESDGPADELMKQQDTTSSRSSENSSEKGSQKKDSHHDNTTSSSPAADEEFPEVY